MFLSVTKIKDPKLVSIIIFNSLLEDEHYHLSSLNVEFPCLFATTLGQETQLFGSCNMWFFSSPLHAQVRLF